LHSAAEMRVPPTLASIAVISVISSVARTSAASGGGTVADAANAGGCSTIVVHGLSKQIVDEVNCLVPNALAAIPNEPNLTESATTFAFLQPPAKDALVAALAANGGMTLSVDSVLRTVAQQYLLYAWYLAGMCGIQLAATPGTSNHEQGLAFDTSDYNAWMGALNSNGFQWYGASDVVHFDYVGAGAVDLNGKDVLAFQKLWNINNAMDLIAEDGQYGPTTESRLKQSPADGFPKGANCGGPPPNDAGAGSDAGASNDAGAGPDADADAQAQTPHDGGGTPPLDAAGGGNPEQGDGASAPGAQASGSSGCRVSQSRSSGDGSLLLVGLLGAAVTRLLRRGRRLPRS
jgi:hypothetical protein